MRRLPFLGEEGLPVQQTCQTGIGTVEVEVGQLRDLPRRPREAKTRSAMRPVPRAIASFVQTRGGKYDLSRSAHDGGKETKPKKSFTALVGEYSTMAFVLPVSCLV